MVEVVSKTKHSKTKTEARSTQNSKTKHPNLENEGRKTRNLSALYNTRDSPLSSHQCWYSRNQARFNEQNAVQNCSRRTARCCKCNSAAVTKFKKWWGLPVLDVIVKCFTMAAVFTRPVLELRFRNYPVVEYLPDSKCSDLFCSWHILRKKSVVMFSAKKIPCVITVCW